MLDEVQLDKVAQGKLQQKTVKILLPNAWNYDLYIIILDVVNTTISL